MNSSPSPLAIVKPGSKPPQRLTKLLTQNCPAGFGRYFRMRTKTSLWIECSKCHRTPYALGYTGTAYGRWRFIAIHEVMCKAPLRLINPNRHVGP
jgi:hypothetical protein